MGVDRVPREGGFVSVPTGLVYTFFGTLLVGSSSSYACTPNGEPVIVPGPGAYTLCPDTTDTYTVS